MHAADRWRRTASTAIIDLRVSPGLRQGTAVVVLLLGALSNWQRPPPETAVVVTILVRAHPTSHTSVVCTRSKQAANATLQGSDWLRTHV
jgi:hypothetical protein